MKIAEMSNKQLKENYSEVSDRIDVTGCFGVSDLLWRDALECELIKRGATIKTRTEVILGDND